MCQSVYQIIAPPFFLNSVSEIVCSCICAKTDVSLSLLPETKPFRHSLQSYPVTDSSWFMKNNPLMQQHTAARTLQWRIVMPSFQNQICKSVLLVVIALCNVILAYGHPDLVFLHDMSG